MAVIRQSQAIRLAEEAISLDLGDLQRQGEALVSRSREQAAAIVAQAHAERERIMRGIEETARQQGIAAGKAEGIEQGRKLGHEAALRERRAQLDAIEKSWQAALASFEQSRAAMLQQAREDVLALAVQLAHRIVRRSVAQDATIIVEQLESALRTVVRPSSLTVAIASADESTVREALPSVLARIGSAHSVSIVVDAAAKPGTCIARTAGGGIIDASIESQLARVVDALVPGREAQMADNALPAKAGAP
jgi:flagellar assembly protein FliH